MYINREKLCNHFYTRNYTTYSKKIYDYKYPKLIREKLRHKKLIPIYNIDFIQDEDSFINYIKTHYIIENQVVKNIHILFSKLQQLQTNKRLYWDIVEMIDVSYQCNLIYTKRKLTKSEHKFLVLINETIYIENGHSSELWFSILFNGSVCGSLNNILGGIESDVIKGNQTISLKCYKKLYNIELGSLSDSFVQYLKKFTILSEIITGLECDKSYGRLNLNKILKLISSNKISNDIHVMKSMCSDLQNDIIFNFVSYIEKTFGAESSIVESFKFNLNSGITEKIMTVDWWVFIVDNDLIVIPSKRMLSSLLMTSSKMKMSIKNFKGFRLFINGNYI